VAQELAIISGRDACGEKFNLQITSVRENYAPSSKIVAWLIFGVCNKCKVMNLQAIIQQEKEPVPDLDYFVLEDEIADGISLKTFLEKK
jgi:hypothetical protein